MNLLRPANADEYRRAGEVVKAGRTITVAHALAYPGDGDQPLAVMTGTIMSLVGVGIRH